MCATWCAWTRDLCDEVAVALTVGVGVLGAGREVVCGVGAGGCMGGGCVEGGYLWSGELRPRWMMGRGGSGLRGDLCPRKPRQVTAAPGPCSEKSPRRLLSCRFMLGGPRDT